MLRLQNAAICIIESIPVPPLLSDHAGNFHCCLHDFFFRTHIFAVCIVCLPGHRPVSVGIVYVSQQPHGLAHRLPLLPDILGRGQGQQEQQEERATAGHPECAG